MLKITSIGKQSWNEVIPSSPPPIEHGQPDWDIQIDAATPDHPVANQKSLNVALDMAFFDTPDSAILNTTIKGTSDIQNPMWELFWKFFEAKKIYTDPISLEYGVGWVLRDIESDTTNACGVHVEIPDDTTKGDWAFKPALLGRGAYIGNIGLANLRTQQYPFQLLIDGLSAGEKLEIISINGHQAADSQWSFKPGQPLTFRINAPNAKSVQMIAKNPPTSTASTQSGAFLPWTVICSFPTGTHDLGIRLTNYDNGILENSGDLGTLVISPDVPAAPVLEALGDAQHKTSKPVTRIAGQSTAGNQVELIASDLWGIHTWKIQAGVNDAHWDVALSAGQQLLGGIYRIAARCKDGSLWSMPGVVETVNVDTSEQVYVDGVQETGEKLTVWGRCSHSGEAKLYGRSRSSKPVLLSTFSIDDTYWKTSFTLDRLPKGYGPDPIELLVVLPSGAACVTSRVITL